MEVRKVERYELELTREEVEFIIDLYNCCQSEGIGLDDNELGVIYTLSQVSGIPMMK